MPTKKKKYILGELKNKGIITIPLTLDFGPSQKIIEITQETNIKEVLGYDLQHPKMLLLREGLKKADKILLYRVNTGKYAIGNTPKGKIISQYPGERGNDIKILIYPVNKWGQVSKSDGDEWGQVFKIGVVTMLEGEVVEVQYVGCLDELRDNAYVRFEMRGEISEEEYYEVELCGGETFEARIREWDRFFEVIGYYDWRVMALPVGGVKVKRRGVKLIKHLREVEGRSVYVVMGDFAEANSEGVLSVANGVELSDGVKLTANECTVFVAASVASATLEEGIVLNAYEGAIGLVKKMSHAQMMSYLDRGEIVFVKSGKKVVIAEDINTFKAFTPKKTNVYRENRFVRIVDVIREDLHKLMKIYYSAYIKRGKSPQECKQYYKEVCVQYIKLLQNRNLLYDCVPENDIAVYLAEELDGADISLEIKIKNMAEKVYVGISYNKMLG
ncbi:MAG: phage tail sheath subtilisin-like domain-containing protein [Clostridium sp.]|nr:phage tail sheath subtilisin-like domain-containing protein [Clostridium sp.]